MAGIRDYKKYMNENYNNKELTLEDVQNILKYWKDTKKSFSFYRKKYNDSGYGELVASSENKNKNGNYTTIVFYGFVEKDTTDIPCTWYKNNLNRCAKLNYKFNPSNDGNTRESNEEILSKLKVGDKIFGSVMVFRQLDKNRADDEGLLYAIENGFTICEISEMTERNEPNYLNHTRNKTNTQIWLRTDIGDVLTNLSAEYCLYQYIDKIINKMED